MRKMTSSEIAANHCRELVNSLTGSERGRDVAADLYDLLMGRIDGLDQFNMNSVRSLLEIYALGFQGSVLDSLRPWRIPAASR